LAAALAVVPVLAVELVKMAGRANESKAGMTRPTPA
jgi:hypothetical protein